MAQAEQIRSLDVTRLGRPVGRLARSDLGAVDNGYSLPPRPLTPSDDIISVGHLGRVDCVRCDERRSHRIRIVVGETGGELGELAQEQGSILWCQAQLAEHRLRDALCW